LIQIHMLLIFYVHIYNKDEIFDTNYKINPNNC